MATRKNITGKNIRRTRLGRGMTPKELSFSLPEASRLSTEELDAIEAGNRKVFDHELLAIADALGIKVSDLFVTPWRKVKKHKVFD